MTKLLWVEISLLLLVLVVYPAVVWVLRRNREASDRNLDRALYLPNGSIRAMLALLIVGSFLNVLVLGSEPLHKHFEAIVAAFGTLAGSVTGFYFGTRSSQPPPTDP